jgi:hypothetical protein
MTTLGDWSVMLSVSARDDSTEADARLPMSGGTALTGHGTARRNPSDENVTKIGEELAVARALSDLAHRLLRVATADVETVTHGRAHLQM